MASVNRLAGLALIASIALGAVACSSEEPTTTPTTPLEEASDCVAEGARTIAVPDVIGKPLDHAIREIEAAGLVVVDPGTPDGDPVTETAVVWAQEPSSEAKVPRGACVGFRTEEPTP